MSLKPSGRRASVRNRMKTVNMSAVLIIWEDSGGKLNGLQNHR
jgi:hypothetical protein